MDLVIGHLTLAGYFRDHPKNVSTLSLATSVLLISGSHISLILIGAIRRILFLNTMLL